MGLILSLYNGTIRLSNYQYLSQSNTHNNKCKLKERSCHHLFCLSVGCGNSINKYTIQNEILDLDYFIDDVLPFIDGQFIGILFMTFNLAAGQDENH